MRAVLCGANGAMGKLVQNVLKDRLAGCVSIDGEGGVAKTFAELGKVDADVVIDFSHHSAVSDMLEYAIQRGCAAVIGTTGHSPQEQERIRAAAKKIPVFWAGNMSLGIAVLCKLAKQAAEMFPEADIEILEIHHNRKADAPSGTAKMLFEAVKAARPELTANCGRAGEGKRLAGEVGISSVRMGNVVGIHEVHICTPSQTLTLRHEAHDRAMFAQGAVEAAEFVAGKLPGVYTMTDMLEEKA